MNQKFILLAVALVALIGLWFLPASRGKNRPETASPDTGLIISPNAIYVAEQDPGDTVLVSLVHLAKPGFVVIHQDNAGLPGAVLGVSALLPAGETKYPVPVMLNRPTANGEIIYAMIHIDDGNGLFNIERDTPAVDPIVGQPVMMIVTVGTMTVPAGINL